MEKDLAMWPRMALDLQIFCHFLQVLENRYMPHCPVFPSFSITARVVHFLFFMSKNHKHTQGCTARYIDTCTVIKVMHSHTSYAQSFKIHTYTCV